ncbi:MAG: hypothetical protein HKN59_00375 [Gammaproteobacteria bacterium]|nr:hypothetical protein [Gammaproteobacteria bacterium]
MFVAAWIARQQIIATTPWSDAELALLRSLALDALPPPPPSPGNAVADDARAVEFGRRLFFDPRLSANGQISCSTCHQPVKNFTDGLKKARALGVSQRNTRSIAAAAYSPWQYADGRRDSLWSQALAPLEDPAEHGGTRMQYARFIATEPVYRKIYEGIFGDLSDFSDRSRFPDMAAPSPDPAAHKAWAGMSAEDRRTVNRVFSNLGKALAAFERTQLPGASPFDYYVASLSKLGNNEQKDQDIFGAREIAGLRLFIGKAQCIDCHNGPLFTNNEFHNTGALPYPGDLPDRGRAQGLREARTDEFNCLGEYSDDSKNGCPELRFARDDATIIGAMRTPSLRNIADTAPYMHKGQIKSLFEVIDHYRRAEPAIIGHNEAKPLALSRRERNQLFAFMKTLSGPLPGQAPQNSSGKP